MSSNPPSQYPKARHEAQQVVRHLRTLLATTASPPTEIASVADASYQLEHGYISASTRHGPIQVYGVPQQSVVQGMQIYVRKMTHKGINTYVFDGHAPPALNTSTTSKSIIAGIQGTGPVSGSANPVGPVSPPYTVIPASPPTTGWFWSFFLYLPSLPIAPAGSGSQVVLIDSCRVDTSGNPLDGVQIIYDATGVLSLATYNVSSGISTTQSITQVIAPHHIWFVVCQVGNGITVNNVQTGLAIPGGAIVAGNYTTYLLGDRSGYYPAPIGTWMSKVTFGCNYASGSAIWPYALNSMVPNQDSQIVSGTNSLGSGLTVYNRWLFSDFVSGTVPDTGLSGVNLYLYQSARSLATIGPY